MHFSSAVVLLSTLFASVSAAPLHQRRDDFLFSNITSLPLSTAASTIPATSSTVSPILPSTGLSTPTTLRTVTRPAMATGVSSVMISTGTSTSQVPVTSPSILSTGASIIPPTATGSSTVRTRTFGSPTGTFRFTPPTGKSPTPSGNSSLVASPSSVWRPHTATTYPQLSSITAAPSMGTGLPTGYVSGTPGIMTTPMTAPAWPSFRGNYSAVWSTLVGSGITTVPSWTVDSVVGTAMASSSESEVTFGVPSATVTATSTPVATSDMSTNSMYTATSTTTLRNVATKTRTATTTVTTIPTTESQISPTTPSTITLTQAITTVTVTASSTVTQVAVATETSSSNAKLYGDFPLICVELKGNRSYPSSIPSSILDFLEKY